MKSLKKLLAELERQNAKSWGKKSLVVDLDKGTYKTCIMYGGRDIDFFDHAEHAKLGVAITRTLKKLKGGRT